MAINVRAKDIVTIVVIVTAVGGIAYSVSSLYHLTLSDTLQGIIIGGIIGFGSGIGVKVLEDWIKRPKLLIGKKPRIPVGTNLYGRSRNIRIEVENQGSTAAEDCKASIEAVSSEPPESYLVKERRVRRVAWMIPKLDFTVTINADDSEFIDLCVFTYPQGIGGGDVVLPTERGYPEVITTPGPDVRLIDVGTVVKLRLKVSASNARKCVKDIWIRNDQDEEKRDVYFSEPSAS